jgi:hypothetical protein
MNASILQDRTPISGDRHLRIGRVYLTGMIAAIPVAVAAIFVATPTAGPANVQLSLDAAGQSAVLEKLAPPLAPCRWPGGDSPQSPCPGSNQTNTTRNSDQRTGTPRYGPSPKSGGANPSPGNNQGGAGTSPAKPNPGPGMIDGPVKKFPGLGRNDPSCTNSCSSNNFPKPNLSPGDDRPVKRFPNFPKP